MTSRTKLVSLLVCVLAVVGLYGWAISVRGSQTAAPAEVAEPVVANPEEKHGELAPEPFSFLELGSVTVDRSFPVHSWSYFQNYVSSIFYAQQIVDSLPFEVNETFLFHLFVQSINEFPKEQSMTYRKIHLKRFAGEETDIVFSTDYRDGQAELKVNVVPSENHNFYDFSFSILHVDPSDVNSELRLVASNFPDPKVHVRREVLDLYWKCFWNWVFDETGHRRSAVLRTIADLRRENLYEPRLLDSFEKLVEENIPDTKEFVSEEKLAGLFIKNYWENGGQVDLSAFLMLHELASRVSIAPM